jgi:hypothetical protein
MFLAALLGCGQDLLLLGDVTGLASARPPDRLVLPAPAPVAVAPVEVTPPAPLPDGTIPVVEGVEAVAAAATPPADFNPISIPEGPREGEGVRWEGVKAKGRAPPPVGSRRGADRDFSR